MIKFSNFKVGNLLAVLLNKFEGNYFDHWCLSMLMDSNDVSVFVNKESIIFRNICYIVNIIDL